MAITRSLAVATALLLAHTVPAAGLQTGAPLPLGELAAATLSPDGPAVFAFSASTAGMLTVMVQGEGDTDFVLEVGGALGTTFEDGRSDMDLYGHVGNERVAVMLRRPGDYQVRVSSYAGRGSFQIGATWLATPGLELPPDPDGSPATAVALVPGTAVDETLAADAGDDADWYVFEATADSAVTVLTEGTDDITIEAYADGEFGEYMDRSDQDMLGAAGNESLTVRLRAGEKVYFRVAPFSRAASYSIRIGVM